MIGDKIRERRNELNLKQSELSLMTGIKATTISNYENNVSTPNEQNLYKLMEALKCDANFLFEWEETEQIQPTYKERQQIKKYRSLDEYGKKAVDDLLNTEYERCTYKAEITPLEMPMSIYGAAAGTGNWLDEEYNIRVKVKDTPIARRANIVIKVSGNSMKPKFSDGDKVLVKIQPDIEVGEIGIFIVDNEGYIKQKGEYELISLNPKYNNIPIGEYTDYRCFGKVLGKAEIIEE